MLSPRWLKRSNFRRSLPLSGRMGTLSEGPQHPSIVRALACTRSRGPAHAKLLLRSFAERSSGGPKVGAELSTTSPRRGHQTAIRMHCGATRGGQLLPHFRANDVPPRLDGACGGRLLPRRPRSQALGLSLGEEKGAKTRQVSRSDAARLVMDHCGAAPSTACDVGIDLAEAPLMHGLQQKRAQPRRPDSQVYNDRVLLGPPNASAGILACSTSSAEAFRKVTSIFSVW